MDYQLIQLLPENRKRMDFTLIACDLRPEDFMVTGFTDAKICMPENMQTASVKRQSEFLAGRLAAQQAMKELNFPLNQIPAAADRSPVWPVGLCGSLTHCLLSGAGGNKVRALCLLAINKFFRKAGIDLENILQKSVCDSVRTHIADLREEQLLTALTVQQGWRGISPEQLLTLLFSAKETLFKALYPEVKQYFDFLDVGLICAHIYAQTDTQLPAVLAGLKLSRLTLSEGQVYGDLVLRQKIKLTDELPVGGEHRVHFVLDQQQVLTLLLG